MATTVNLAIGDKSITVYALVSSRAVQVDRVVCRGRRTWATNGVGRVYCSDITALRKRGVYPRYCAGADELSLGEDDIAALDMLGVLDGKTATRLKEEAEYRRDFKHRFDWLVGDAESLIEAGVKLPKDWRTQVEKASAKRAKKKAAARKNPKQAAL